MTVKELIEKLKIFDQNMPVIIGNEDVAGGWSLSNSFSKPLVSQTTMLESQVDAGLYFQDLQLAFEYSSVYDNEDTLLEKEVIILC